MSIIIPLPRVANASFTLIFTLGYQYVTLFEGQANTLLYLKLPNSSSMYVNEKLCVKGCLRLLCELSSQNHNLGPHYLLMSFEWAATRATFLTSSS